MSSSVEVFVRQPAGTSSMSKQVFPTNGAHRSLTTSWKVTGFLNKLKPAGGGLKEPVKKRRSLFNVFWKGGTPLPFLARSKRLSVSTCFCSLVQSPLKWLASMRPATSTSESPSTMYCKSHWSTSFQNAASETTSRKPLTNSTTGASHEKHFWNWTKEVLKLGGLT